MKHFISLLTVALLALATGSVAASDESRERLVALTADLQSMQADFEQWILDENGNVLEESSGEFALQAPNLFRWHYESPYEQVIVADGTRVWLHDVDLEQVTVKSQDDAASSSPLYVLTRPEILDERYTVEALESRAGIEQWRLTPRSTEAEFEYVDLGFRADALEFVTIHDAFGQLTQIQFNLPELNGTLAADLFAFIPPEGVDVLGTDDLLVETFDAE